MSKTLKRPSLPARRPAETAGVAFAVAAIICRVVGVTDNGVVLDVATVVGFVPAAVTWLVETVRSRGTAL